VGPFDEMGDARSSERLSFSSLDLLVNKGSVL